MSIRECLSNVTIIVVLLWSKIENGLLVIYKVQYVWSQKLNLIHGPPLSALISNYNPVVIGRIGGQQACFRNVKIRTVKKTQDNHWCLLSKDTFALTDSFVLLWADSTSTLKVPLLWGCLSMPPVCGEWLETNLHMGNLDRRSLISALVFNSKLKILLGPYKC